MLYVVSQKIKFRPFANKKLKKTFIPYGTWQQRVNEILKYLI